MKWLKEEVFTLKLESPSVWREWIEIARHRNGYADGSVSLRVEGVD